MRGTLSTAVTLSQTLPRPEHERCRAIAIVCPSQSALCATCSRKSSGSTLRTDGFVAEAPWSCALQDASTRWWIDGEQMAKSRGWLTLRECTTRPVYLLKTSSPACRTDTGARIAAASAALWARSEAAAGRSKAQASAVSNTV